MEPISYLILFLAVIGLVFMLQHLMLKKTTYFGSLSRKEKKCLLFTVPIYIAFLCYLLYYLDIKNF